jgi:two-component system, NtrC family, response regulator GlrR
VDTPRLVGCSRAHREILEKLTRVAPTDVEVLIMGPSGVGKELYASHVHLQSHRSHCRFVPVNCGSLSSDLLENTLFGHVGGAFTGATSLGEGLVNEAEGGTLFLDEVDSLSVPCQAKLLRFLQDQKYRRLGEGRLRQANVRVVAATNSDLEEAVNDGRFRMDLFFRLRVVPVEIPALCHRTEDIPELVAAFTASSATSYKLPALKFEHATIERMQGYDWPGNIRELENCIAYLTCLRLGRPIGPHDLPFLTRLRRSDATASKEPPEVDQPLVSIDTFQEIKTRLISEFERQYIERALQSTGGNVSAAARISGKNRRAGRVSRRAIVDRSFARQFLIKAMTDEIQSVRVELDESRSVSTLLQNPPAARACYVFAHGAEADMSHQFIGGDFAWIG